MSKPTPPAENACPHGGNHTFIFGRCFNCGLSIRIHKERVKATNRIKWMQRQASLKLLKEVLA